MKKTLLLALFLFLFIFAISGCKKETGRQLSEIREKALVTQVSDGDTIVIQGGKIVRLLGIDSKEENEPYGKEAKEWLEGRILFKEIELEKDKQDKDQYGRLLRWIWLNGSLINEEIVLEGYAIAKFFGENKKYQARIQEAERQAIKQKKGIWKNLEKTETSVIEAEKCILLGCPLGTSLVASKNSDKFHKCSCRFARKIKKENLLCLKNKEEAITKGYIPCGSCKP
ncbi:MAG: thermonuclease family protein [Candidatus Pacearchaeota archaeon]|nr:thermonuclease family protein [Candidatus Pacearchaeota archaeon]